MRTSQSPFSFFQLRVTFIAFIYAVFKVRIHAFFFFNPGAHLLSRTVSGTVPSAAQVLTVVFGMGTGVSPERVGAGSFSFDR